MVSADAPLGSHRHLGCSEHKPKDLEFVRDAVLCLLVIKKKKALFRWAASRSLSLLMNFSALLAPAVSSP